MDLLHVRPLLGGLERSDFALTAFAGTDHARQCRFDVQQGASDIHQHCIVGLALALTQALDNRDLIEDHLARLTKAQHGQCVGHLAQCGQQAVEFIDVLAVALHELVKAQFAVAQLVAHRTDHRAQRIAIRAGKRRRLRAQQRLTRLLQGFGHGLPQPWQRVFIAPINHKDSDRRLSPALPLDQRASVDGGKVKPETERRSSLAMRARLPMLSAVVVESAEVWVVIC